MIEYLIEYLSKLVNVNFLQLGLSENVVEALVRGSLLLHILRLFAVDPRGLHEFLEQGIGVVRSTGQFGMELRSHEERMICNLEDLHDFLVRRHTREDHTVGLNHLAVLVVEFVPVPKPLYYMVFFVAFVCHGTMLNLHVMAAKPHCPPHAGQFSLLG